MSTTNNTTNMSTPRNNKNEELDGAPNMAESTSNTNTMPVSYFSSIDQKQLGKNASEKSQVLHKIMDNSIWTNNANAAKQAMKAGLNPNNCYTSISASNFPGGKLLHTPYSHAAAFGKSLDVLDVLLKSGANIDSLNSSNNTMLDAAFNNGHIKTAIWLVKHGAKMSTQMQLSKISPSNYRDNAIYFVSCIFGSMLKHGWEPCKCKRTQFLQDMENLLAPYRVSKQTDIKRGMLFKYI